MIKIEITSEMKQRHWEYFKKNIATNFEKEMYGKIFENKVNQKKNKLRNESKVKCLDEFSKNGVSEKFTQFIQFCKINAESLAIGDVNELKTLYDMILHEYGYINSPQTLEQEIYSDVILELFGYETFTEPNSSKPDTVVYLQMRDAKQEFGTEWTPYTFVFLSNLRVCPYCNRQYITPILAPKGRVRADIDHFLPKSKYPYFSMSLYNLVPSCKSCNSSLKGTKVFTFNDPHPYRDNCNDYFKFEADFKSLMDIDLNVKKNTCDRNIDHFLDVFKIKELYKYHENIAADFIQKRLMWTDNLWTDFSENVYNSYVDQAALKASMIGYPYCKENINQEALGKLKRDLAEQLGFVKSENENVDLIRKLKCIVKEAKS